MKKTRLKYDAGIALLFIVIISVLAMLGYVLSVILTK